MTKYRYAKSNGEFLKSKFLQNVESGNENDFTQSESYNLKKILAYGTDPSQNSFISNIDSTKYYDAGASLVSWWRLNKDISSAGSGNDSSGNKHTLTPPTAADRPAFDTGDTPTAFIQESSCLFDGTNVLEAPDSNSFSFGNGVKDQPFSISCWVKFTSLTNNQVLVAKSSSGFSEWYLFKNTGDGVLRIHLQDIDSSGALGRAAAVSTDTITAGLWYHVAVTYLGNAGESANTTNSNGLKIYINAVDCTDSYATGQYYSAMHNTVANPSIGNFDDEMGSYGLDGNLADVAIWGGKLSQTDITTLYSIKNAGAYRLVRDFKQLSPENDTRLFGVVTSGRGVDLSGLPSDILEQFRQGINVNTHRQLGSYTAFKVRANNSFITTLNGVDVSTKAFNEELSTSSFSSGDYAQAWAKFDSSLPGSSWANGEGTLSITDTRGVKLLISPSTELHAGIIQKISPADVTNPAGHTYTIPASADPFVPSEYYMGVKGTPTVAIITKALHDIIELAKNNGDIQIKSSYNSANETTYMTQLAPGQAGNVTIVSDSSWDGLGFTGGTNGAAAAHVSLGGSGKVSARISHESEQRDLGQSDVYVNHDKYEIYEDTQDLNPVGILSKRPENLVLPRQLVVQTSNELNDGAIEPLIIRKKIDHTSIEGPFFAHDIRASLGGGLEDSFRRSLVIVYGRDLDEPAQGTAPFLDSVEMFGATGSFGGVDLPGAFSTDAGKISPFVDYLNGRDKEYTTNGIASTIATVMILSASFETANIRTHDKMAASGFVFDNDNIGLDSIAYGGLKK